MLLVDELNEAKDCMIRTSYLRKASYLISLYPFLDKKRILRVGGRLQKSVFSYNKKQPIIIPYGCKLMWLIIDEAHKTKKHGGNQLTLSQIRHEYWITAGKRAVKIFINKCVISYRFRTKGSHQLMGSLPGSRTNIVEKALTHTGTDLCGPIHLKMSANRGVKTQKGYIVIFICFSTSWQTGPCISFILRQWNQFYWGK